MSKLSLTDQEGLYIFFCPGCDCYHVVNTKAGNKASSGMEWPVWQLSGGIDNPTVRASIRVMAQYVCHSYITDGKIEFLPDSTHHLSGQIVELPDFDNF